MKTARLRRLLVGARGVQIPAQELLAATLPRPGGDEFGFEVAAFRLRELPETGLAEVLEGLVLALPALALFVVLSGFRARALFPTGDAGNPFLLAGPHRSTLGGRPT